MEAEPLGVLIPRSGRLLVKYLHDRPGGVIKLLYTWYTYLEASKAWRGKIEGLGV